MASLGATYRDKITGFEGVATGYVQYITGCNQVLLAPKSTDGTMKDSQWLDEQRLELDEFSPIVKLDNGSNPGFERAPPRR
ncbi:hypothetical protein [Sinorhizobium meliloti]|uniref:hypothetical protein n=1 Tax=Rhizobium meliloti TaxID=382 RepID=UPI0004109960|nr:hypothetical protein [Sinorhizobium meliloti]